MRGAKRRAVREGGSILSRLTTRTRPAMCPPLGPLDLQCSSPYTIRPVSDAYNQTGTVTRAQRR